jgi:hypothetical protein
MQGHRDAGTSGHLDAGRSGAVPCRHPGASGYDPLIARFHVIRRLHLSRRTFLRGAGAGIALPWLDAMCPALRPLSSGPTRSVFIFAPNGKKMDDWIPQTTGTDYQLPFLLEPLSAVRRDFSVLSNLAIDAGRAHGDGPGDHARAAATYLTCKHPRKTGGQHIVAGTSIDQVIAQKYGQATLFPSLEFGMEGGRKGGVCDSGYSCAYSNNIAWRSPSEPVAKEVNPRTAFARLFGAPKVDPATDARDRRRLRSVLDAALADAKSLRGRLGAADRAKLDGYLASVREFEQRLIKLEAKAPKVPLPDKLWHRDDAPRFVQRLQLMYDLIVLALQTDQTRVLTFMLGNAGSNLSYRFLDIPEGHHFLSHHRNDPGKLAKIGKINRFHVEQFARFIGRLRDIQDGDRSLLHRSMIVYGSGIGDGNRHDHMNLPVLLAGHGNGRLHPGRHLQLPRHTPMANLYLTLLGTLELDVGTFADGTGRLSL